MAKEATKHVKNVSGIEQNVIGYGIVAAGESIEVAAGFNNANFEEVKAPKNKTETK